MQNLIFEKNIIDFNKKHKCELLRLFFDEDANMYLISSFFGKNRDKSDYIREVSIHNLSDRFLYDIAKFFCKNLSLGDTKIKYGNMMLSEITKPALSPIKNFNYTVNGKYYSIITKL